MEVDKETGLANYIDFTLRLTAEPSMMACNAMMNSRLGDCSGRDVLLSGPPDLAPAVAARLARLGADPELVRHDPVPDTLDRSRPASAAERFLQPRDIAWINRTELG